MIPPALTNEELDRREAGLPRLADYGEDLLVAFPVRPADDAAVLWLNDRWFYARGFAMNDGAVRARIERWILSEFAHTIVDDQRVVAGTPARLFYADRYGSPGAAAHGGSGRCGLIGCFQVKGVGPTPLVGASADWLHAHGCLWIEEAIREAIQSEVATAEFPGGAVPTLAVIDLGQRYVFADGTLGETRALLVRPAALRPAHLERAVVPNAAKTPALDDRADQRRVRDATRQVLARDEPAAADAAMPAFLSTLLRQLARQMAYGQVNRLFNGGFFSSNATLAGELIDFGSFRSLPLWAKVTASNGAPAFGDERLALREIARSLLFTLDKHAPAWRGRLPTAASLETGLADMLLAARRAEFLRLFALDDVSDAPRERLLAAVEAYYERQQRQSLSNLARVREDGRAWLLRDILERHDGEPRSLGEWVVQEIDAALHDLDVTANGQGVGRERAWLTAVRLLRSRELLFREELQQAIWTIVGRRDSDPHWTEALRQLFTTTVGRSRRDWPLLPAGEIVLAQVSAPHSDALLIARSRHATPRLWLQAVPCNDRIVLFGTLLGAHDLSGVDLVRTGDLVGFELPMPANARPPEFAVRVGSALVRIPWPDIVYDAPGWLDAPVSPEPAFHSAEGTR